MIHVSPADICAIIDTSLSNEQIEVFIEAAKTLVETHVTCSAATDAVKKQITIWLTAHLMASTKERMAKSEKLGDASITYTGDFGSGLESTPYGQNALLMDPCGQLGDMGKKEVKITVIDSFES